MRFVVMYVPGQLNESGVGIYVVVDTGGEAITKLAVARCVDGAGAVAVCDALNEEAT